MTQDYSKSFHDFNNWTYPFSLFVLNHPSSAAEVPRAASEFTDSFLELRA